MVASLAPSSRHLLWPTRARRRLTSTTTQRMGPRRTTMRSSTTASVSTHRWQGRSMGQSMIRAPRTLWRSHHEGGRRQEAWAVLDWRRRNRLGRYCQSLPDSSKQHEQEPGHTTSAGHFTPPGGGTRGYSWFIRCSLVFSYLSFALL